MTNYEFLLQQVKQLKIGEKLEISPDGSIRKKYVNQAKGKSKSKPVGNLFTTISELVPLKSKLWGSANTRIWKDKFGKKLPVHAKKDYNSDVVFGVYELFFEEPKEIRLVEENFLTYQIIVVNEFAGYYYYDKEEKKRGNLSFIVDKRGKKYYRQQTLPNLEITYLKKPVK